MYIFIRVGAIDAGWKFRVVRVGERVESRLGRDLGFVLLMGWVCVCGGGLFLEGLKNILLRGKLAVRII